MPVALIARGTHLGQGVLQSTETFTQFLLHKKILECLLCTWHWARHQKFKSNSDTVLKCSGGSGERGGHGFEGFVFHVFYTESRRAMEGI